MSSSLIQSKNLPEWLRLDRRDLQEIMQNIGIIYKELFVKLFLSMVDIARQTGQMEFRSDLLQRLVQRLLENETHLLSVGETIEDALKTFFSLMISKNFGFYEEFKNGYIYRFPVRYSYVNHLLKDLYENVHTEIQDMMGQISIKDGVFPNFPTSQQRKYQDLDFEMEIFVRMKAKEFHSGTIAKYQEKFSGKIVVIEIDKYSVLVSVEDLDQLYKICNAIVKAYVEGIAGDELQWLVKRTQQELKITPEKLNSTLKGKNEDKTFYWLTICTIASQSVGSRKHFAEKKQMPMKIATTLMNSYLLYRRDQELKHELWSKQVEKFIRLVKEKDDGKEELKLLDRGRLLKWMKNAYIGQNYEGNELEEFLKDAIRQTLEVKEKEKWLANLNRMQVDGREHFILRSRVLPLFKKELTYLVESRQVFQFLKRILKEKILSGEISSKRKMSQSRLRSYGRLIQREIGKYLLQNDYVFYALYQNPKVVHSAIHDTSSQPFKDLKMYFLNESSMIFLPYLELFGYELDRLIKAARRSISLFEWIRVWMQRLTHRKHQHEDLTREEELNETKQFFEKETTKIKLGKSQKSTLVGTEKYKQPKNINQASEELKKAMGKLYRH